MHAFISGQSAFFLCDLNFLQDIEVPFLNDSVFLFRLSLSFFRFFFAQSSRCFITELPVVSRHLFIFLPCGFFFPFQHLGKMERRVSRCSPALISRSLHGEHGSSPSGFSSGLFI